MKLLLVGPNNPMNEGGPSAILNRIYENLISNKEIEVLFFYTTKNKLFSYLKFFKILFKNNYDVINVHSGNFLVYILMLMPKYIRKKVILTQHGHMKFEKSMPAFKLFYETILTNYSLKRFYHISLVSTIFKNNLNELIDQTKTSIYIIPNGLEEEIKSFSPNLDVKEIGTIIFIGGTRYYKGLDILLTALIKCNKKFSISVYGPNGNIHNEITKLTELYTKCGGKVQIQGMIEKEKLYEQLSKSNICIFPSRFDSFNVAVLEAMYFKNIVITSNNVGASFLIQQNYNGFVYSNEFELVEIINNLNESNIQLKENAHNTTLSYFWSSIILSYVKMYDAVYQITK